METDFCAELKDACLLRINESADRIRKCVHMLSEEQIWHRQNEHLSPVANLVLHLCGNISQYIISSLGHLPYDRARDMEFAANRSHTQAELLEVFHDTIEAAISIISEAREEELLRVRSVQGFSMTGIGVIIHVTEHLSYHTGQVAMHTKLLIAEDLGFYSGVNLNQ